MTGTASAVSRQFGALLEEQLNVVFFESGRVIQELENRQEDLNVAMGVCRSGIELTREGIRAVMRGDSKDIIRGIEEKIIRYYHVVNGVEQYHSTRRGEDPRILEVPEVSKCLLTALFGQEWVEFKLVSIFWPLIEGSIKEKDIRIPSHIDLFVSMPVYLQGMRDAITEMFRCLRDYRIVNRQSIDLNRVIELLERYMIVNRILYTFMEKFSRLQNNVLITLPDPDPVTKMASKQHRSGGSYKMSLGQIRDSATKVEEELLNATLMAMQLQERIRSSAQQSQHTLMPEPEKNPQPPEHCIEISSEQAAVQTAQAS